MTGSSEHARDVFQQIYGGDHWKGGSGEGSQVEVTDRYRAVVGAVLSGRDVHSVVDAGCGDWQFSHLLDWSSVRYLGVDVVPEVIAANTERFATAGLRFECADVRTDELPAADLLLCKDVLQHWDLGSVERFLARNRSRYRYMLVTNDVASVHIAPDALNTEIALGAWRTMDLERPPFGERAQWRMDYDVRGEWTKRILLLVRRRYRPVAAVRPGSALKRCLPRRFGRTEPAP